MSTAAKLTFATCCVVSISIIAYVHYKQHYDREQLHLGVVRDIERQQRRKIENVYNLQQQLELTKQLQKSIEKQNEL
ncbi:hypothetical protein KPH14_004373 [Odynerus spinipes]|uniref:Protein PET117 homolog, mitochondrial n=1 Tax=Odynerus spinipes TaxID=1348599 RepID=A0AAD9RZC5_9HYME|nr:hypothetical protein KPH14_004373 [Odynerus spinipes]